MDPEEGDAPATPLSESPQAWVSSTSGHSLAGTLQGGGGSSQHSPNTPTTGLRERGNDASRSTGRSGRQNAATRRNMRREERVTVQGPCEGTAT